MSGRWLLDWKKKFLRFMALRIRHKAISSMNVSNPISLLGISVDS
jgi:hypothetical protein